MFNKSIIVSLCIFFVLMIFTSFIKNETRNIEKDIKKLEKEIFVLEKQLNNANVDDHFILYNLSDSVEIAFNASVNKVYSVLFKNISNYYRHYSSFSCTL